MSAGREYGATPDGWSTEFRLQTMGMTASQAYDHRTAQVIALITLIERARFEMAALIPVPSDPEVGEWPCENPADRECLQATYNLLRDAIEGAFPERGPKEGM